MSFQKTQEEVSCCSGDWLGLTLWLHGFLSRLKLGSSPNPKLFCFQLFLCLIHILSYIIHILSFTHPIFYAASPLRGFTAMVSISSPHTQDDFLSLQAGLCNALQHDMYTDWDTVMSHSITGHIASVMYLHWTSKKE